VIGTAGRCYEGACGLRETLAAEAGAVAGVDQGSRLVDQRARLSQRSDGLTHRNETGPPARRGVDPTRRAAERDGADQAVRSSCAPIRAWILPATGQHLLGRSTATAPVLHQHHLAE
jgi:hypothetical protein